MSDWTREMIDQLRALWEDGHSTVQIGVRMGMSKNSIVGKAHRLGLEGRESPIIRSDGPKPKRRKVPRVTGATLPALASQTDTPPIFPVPPRAAPKVRVAVVPTGRISPCCWPVGEPGTREFRFCDAGTVPGKSYCAEHCARAYQKRYTPDPTAPDPTDTHGGFSFRRVDL